MKLKQITLRTLPLILLSLSLVGCTSADLANIGTPDVATVEYCRGVSTSQTEYSACIDDVSTVSDRFSPVTDTECMCSDLADGSSSAYFACLSSRGVR